MRAFFTVSRSHVYKLRISDGTLFGYIKADVDRENYFEIVKILKLIKEQYPKAKLSRLSRKIVENENQCVVKGRFWFATIMETSKLVLLGFALFTFITGILTGQIEW
ncbi:hypothetical protein [Niallia sp. Krafla_26]|uniref:hypothetical protein n=1 Tax=Niallia sp. Krafla_26 TaxID=3064703 RepID=UPI003D179458